MEGGEVVDFGGVVVVGWWVGGIGFFLEGGGGFGGGCEVFVEGVLEGLGLGVVVLMGID